MADFDKKVLRKEYSWKSAEEESKKITGFPDKAVLDRNEGYEVLHFINRYMTTRNLTTIDDFHSIEDMLHQIPGIFRSHPHIKQWLDINLRLITSKILNKYSKGAGV